MTTAIATRTRKKPVRSIRWLSRPVAGKIGTLEITVGKETSHYWARPIPSDYGTAWELTKHDDGESYEVLLAADDKHVCCCKGFSRWGHCKHVSGLLALLAK
jgi:hypothetical protein